MKAIVITRTGGPEVLELREIPDPVIQKDTEVLVKIKAAGVNPIDTKLRKGETYYPVKIPMIPGFDGAGIIEEIGSEVRRFKVGDGVYFFNGGTGGYSGNYAEYTTVDEKYAVLKPKSITFVEVAGAPLVLITAWESLFDRGNLQEGQYVLVHSGAGGVGHVAVQLAKMKNAKICTTVSSKEKKEFVEKLGAEKVVNYKENDFVEEVLKWTDGFGVNLAIDTIGGETFFRTFSAMSFYGDLVTLLQPEPKKDNWKEARIKNLRISYELVLSPIFYGLQKERERQTKILEQCSKFMDEGKLIIYVSKTFSLRDAVYAHQTIEKGSTVGKIVLVIDE